MTQLTKTLADEVMWFLKEYPLLRDDCQYLIAMLWRKQIGEQNHTVHCFEFLGLLANKKVASPESIRRTYQKILEENVELRGPNYAKRHNIDETNFRIELKRLEKYVKPQEEMKL